MAYLENPPTEFYGFLSTFLIIIWHSGEEPRLWSWSAQVQILLLALIL